MLLRNESCEVTLVDKIQILYFLEDRMQEGFIKALVHRIALEESIAPSNLIDDVRSATRGGSRIINDFKDFLRYSLRGITGDVTFLVVSIDGNCKGHHDRVKQLEKYIKPNHPFIGRIVYAVPDPHIERWYIMDQHAFKNGIELNSAPDMPAYKCKKDYYKLSKNQALRTAGIHSLTNGAEYAEKIVENISDLYSLGRYNNDFQFFIENLRIKFRETLRE